MSLAFLLLCSLAPLSPFLQGESISARVEDLLLDLEDPLLANGARIQLLALGVCVTGRPGKSEEEPAT